MLIWGTKAVTRRVTSGEFYCPQCRSTQPYDLMSARKHGHVYWIPLFGMGDPVEYVECRACHGQFVPEVRNAAPPDDAEFRKMFLAAAVATMVAVAGADGRVDGREVQAIRDTVESLTGVRVERTTVETWTGASSAMTLDQAEGMLAALSPMLSDRGKETLIRTAFLLAVADGEISDAEESAVQRLAAALALTPAHLSGILGSIQA